MIDLYQDRFDYYVCSNCTSKTNQCKVQKICDQYGVQYYQQTWQTCPLPLSQEVHQKSSIWKICPPRLNPQVHELILDNDVVFYSKPEEIEVFLETNKTLVTQDSLQYFGRLSNLFTDQEAYNSGIMGLPPKYNFHLEILKYWHNHTISKRFQELPDRLLSYGDEQGLLTYALLQHPHIVVNSERFVGIHAKFISELVFNHNYEYVKTPTEHDYTYSHMEKIKKAPVIHFLEANRAEYHHGWELLKPQKKIYL